MAVNNSDVLESLAQSEDYDLLANEAQRIVGQVLAQSLIHIRDENSDGNEDHHHHRRERFVELENDQRETKVSKEAMIQWPTIEEFTDKNIGIERINEYIEKQWKTTSGAQDPCWLYVTDFVEKKSLEFTDLYIYRVRYSIPTRRQPVPKHTASIYFTFDVSKVKPQNTPIPVSFVFETMRLIHDPANFRFRQTYLENILLLKAKLTNAIDF